MVVIGFAPVDLRRVVNVYRRFLSSGEWPLAKPRFRKRTDGTLDLLPNPLPRREDYVRLMNDPRAVSALGDTDHWYSAATYEHVLHDVSATYRLLHGVWQRLSRRVLNPGRTVRGGVLNARSAEFALQVAILDAFVEEARDSGVTAVVLMLPDRESMRSLRQGKRPLYAPLTDSMRSHGVVVWDAGDAFSGRVGTLSKLFMPGGHYTPSGNRALAEWLLAQVARLRQETPLSLDARTR